MSYNPNEMNALRTHAVVGNDGTIVLDKLPLIAGQQVEVLILSPDLGKDNVKPSVGLKAMLLEAPTFSEEDIQKIEEARQWLNSWRVAS